MRKPRPALLVAVLSGAGIIVAALLGLGSLIDGSREGSVESVGQRPASSSPPVPAVVDSQVAEPSGPSPSASTTESGSSMPQPVLTPVPRKLAIPALSLASRVVPVGLEPNGAIEIPDDVDLVGWYAEGVAPGAERGSAVLVAHRDGRGQGPGVFYDLGRLELGDTVRVTDDAGGIHRYEVVARESIRKSRLPLEELFSPVGPPRLTLISCGGYYDAERGGYQDNVVVTAVPIYG